MGKEYKDTLLMPQTEFQMKADLKNKEEQFRNFWSDKDVYRKVLKENKENGKGQYVLHDGPPYANGDLHVGHALNKILKDIIIRRKNMEGFYSPYVPGWDTHGLPIENKMLEEMNVQKDDINKLELRKQAAKYALKQVDNQKAQFLKFQLFSDFKETYVTLDKKYETKQLELFKHMALNKLVYKGLKPVYWSPSSQSALAEAEVEYQDHMSPQVIVAFDISKGNDFIEPETMILIMTTTPWTLIANSGVAVGKDIEYSVVQVEDKKYVVASQLLESTAKLSKWEKYDVVKTIIGKDLVGVEYTRPLKRDLVGRIVLGHHVDIEVGTGLVHMAPLFGEDDYLIGKENDLDMIMHVDHKGDLNNEAGEFEGKFYSDANKDIGLKLDGEGKLLSLKFLKHSYPFDWRTHKPVIYRGVPQWFVNIKDVKQDILNELKKVKSTPDWGVSRLSKMIETRDEWTISRQRTWGVPLIIFYDENENPVLEEEVFDYVINLVKENGTDIWWEKETDELLPEKYRNKNFTREMDIMDVWYDSGSSSIAVEIDGVSAPFDLYLEGSDQYRGWFNSSLINSVIYRKQSPFKNLLSHGFVLDGKQQKMSKSKGNVVDPLEIISKHGAEVLRLWTANSEYTSDITISEEIIKQNIEVYRKIRNTFKFMLGNLFDFDYKKDKVELKGVHKEIKDIVDQYESNVNSYYNKFRFLEIIKETNKLFIDLSGWYFSYGKDTLYCDEKDNVNRRSIQTNIYNILKVTLKSLAPIIPTTVEEAYQLFNMENKKESIFFERIDSKEFKNESNFLIKGQREKANLVLEEAIKNGVMKRTNEVLLHVDIEEDKRVGNEEDYAKFFMVAKVKFSGEYKVETFDSEKCQRCWNHFSPNELKENICSRCEKVIGV